MAIHAYFCRWVQARFFGSIFGILCRCADVVAKHGVRPDRDCYMRCDSRTWNLVASAFILNVTDHLQRGSDCGFYKWAGALPATDSLFGDDAVFFRNLCVSSVLWLLAGYKHRLW